MVNFKKVVAILCSATMIVASPITAFAEDPAPTTPATTTEGAGNIVAYSFETLTVPTAVKVSFNPQGWDFTIRGTGDDAVKSNSQIVSLNYGISSMATMNRKVTVSFAAEGTAGDNGGDVIFVDSEEKATAKSAENADGAEFGEYKLYLAVAPAAAPVTKGYKADDASEVAFEVDSEHKSTVTSALLSDVDMTAAEGGLQAFMPGDDDGNASIAYKLNKAVYELTADAVLDFGTTSADMADMVQPKTLGSIVGFKFVGAMNENADWTKAKLSAIKITPTYEVDDADGTETDYEGGGFNQITTEPAAPTAPSVSANTVAVGGSVDITLPDGITITAIQKTKADGSYNAVPEEFYTLEDITGGKKLTIAENYLATYAAGTTVKIVFSEGDPITISVTAQ